MKLRLFVNAEQCLLADSSGAAQARAADILQGRLRECCPVILGYAADGREALLACQFAGATSSRSKLPQSRCFYIGGISDLGSRPGAWLEGTSHTQAQNCVHFVDVDVNVPESLTRDLPLAFGTKAPRAPRR